MLHGPILRRRLNLFPRAFTLALAVALALSANLAPVVQAAATIFIRTDGSDTLCNGTADAPASSAHLRIRHHPERGHERRRRRHGQRAGGDLQRECADH